MILIVFNFMTNAKSENGLKPDLSLYTALFYEFKDDIGATRSHFYTFYFLRRLAFILSVFCLSSYPIIQICLFEIFSLSVINI